MSRTRQPRFETTTATNQTATNQTATERNSNTSAVVVPVTVQSSQNSQKNVTAANVVKKDAVRSGIPERLDTHNFTGHPFLQYLHFMSLFDPIRFAAAQPSYLNSLQAAEKRDGQLRRWNEGAVLVPVYPGADVLQTNGLSDMQHLLIKDPDGKEPDTYDIDELVSYDSDDEDSARQPTYEESQEELQDAINKFLEEQEEAEEEQEKAAAEREKYIASREKKTVKVRRNPLFLGGRKEQLPTSIPASQTNYALQFHFMTQFTPINITTPDGFVNYWSEPLKTLHGTQNITDIKSKFAGAGYPLDVTNLAVRLGDTAARTTTLESTQSQQGQAATGLSGRLDIINGTLASVNNIIGQLSSNVSDQGQNINQVTSDVLNLGQQFLNISQQQQAADTKLQQQFASLTSLNNSFSQFSSDQANNTAEFFKQIDFVNEAIRNFNLSLNGTKILMSWLQVGLSDLANNQVLDRENIYKLNETISNITQTLAEQDSINQEYSASIVKLFVALNVTDDTVSKHSGAIIAVENGLTSLSSLVSALQNVSSEQNGTLDDLSKDLAAQHQQLTNLATAQQTLATQQQQLNATLIAVLDQLSNNTKDIPELFVQVSDLRQGVANNSLSLNDAIQRIRAIETALPRIDIAEQEIAEINGTLTLVANTIGNITQGFDTQKNIVDALNKNVAELFDILNNPNVTSNEVLAVRLNETKTELLALQAIVDKQRTDFSTFQGEISARAINATQTAHSGAISSLQNGLAGLSYIVSELQNTSVNQNGTLDVLRQNLGAQQQQLTNLTNAQQTFLTQQQQLNATLVAALDTLANNTRDIPVLFTQVFDLRQQFANGSRTLNETIALFNLVAATVANQNAHIFSDEQRIGAINDTVVGIIGILSNLTQIVSTQQAGEIAQSIVLGQVQGNLTELAKANIDLGTRLNETQANLGKVRSILNETISDYAQFKGDVNATQNIQGGQIADLSTAVQIVNATIEAHKQLLGQQGQDLSNVTASVEQLQKQVVAIESLQQAFNRSIVSINDRVEQTFEGIANNTGEIAVIKPQIIEIINKIVAHNTTLDEVQKQVEFLNQTLNQLQKNNLIPQSSCYELQGLVGNLTTFYNATSTAQDAIIRDHGAALSTIINGTIPELDARINENAKKINETGGNVERHEQLIQGLNETLNAMQNGSPNNITRRVGAAENRLSTLELLLLNTLETLAGKNITVNATALVRQQYSIRSGNAPENMPYDELARGLIVELPIRIAERDATVRQQAGVDADGKIVPVSNRIQGIDSRAGSADEKSTVSIAFAAVLAAVTGAAGIIGTRFWYRNKKAQKAQQPSVEMSDVVDDHKPDNRARQKREESIMSDASGNMSPDDQLLSSPSAVAGRRASVNGARRSTIIVRSASTQPEEEKAPQPPVIKTVQQRYEDIRIKYDELQQRYRRDLSKIQKKESEDDSAKIDFVDLRVGVREFIKKELRIILADEVQLEIELGYKPRHPNLMRFECNNINGLKSPDKVHEYIQKNIDRLGKRIEERTKAEESEVKSFDQVFSNPQEILQERKRRETIAQKNQEGAQEYVQDYLLNHEEMRAIIERLEAGIEGVHEAVKNSQSKEEDALRQTAKDTVFIKLGTLILTYEKDTIEALLQMISGNDKKASLESIKVPDQHIKFIGKDADRTNEHYKDAICYFGELFAKRLVEQDQPIDAKVLQKMVGILGRDLGKSEQDLAALVADFDAHYNDLVANTQIPTSTSTMSDMRVPGSARGLFSGRRSIHESNPDSYRRSQPVQRLGGGFAGCCSGGDVEERSVGGSV